MPEGEATFYNTQARQWGASGRAWILGVGGYVVWPCGRGNRAAHHLSTPACFGGAPQHNSRPSPPLTYPCFQETPALPLRSCSRPCACSGWRTILPPMLRSRRGARRSGGRASCTPGSVTWPSSCSMRCCSFPACCACCGTAIPFVQATSTLNRGRPGPASAAPGSRFTSTSTVGVPWSAKGSASWSPPCATCAWRLAPTWPPCCACCGRSTSPRRVHAAAPAASAACAAAAAAAGAAAAFVTPYCAVVAAPALLLMCCWRLRISALMEQHAVPPMPSYASIPMPHLHRASCPPSFPPTLLPPAGRRRFLPGHQRHRGSLGPHRLLRLSRP